MKLYADWETWSSVAIQKGTDVYTDHATPIVLTYAPDDDVVRCVSLATGEKVNSEFMDMQREAEVIVAHNFFFDSMVARKCMGWDWTPQGGHCTQAQALSHALPGGLGPLCEVLGLPTDKQKDKDGMRLIRLFCGPHEPCEPEKYPDDWQKFLEYAEQDIVSMRAAMKAMPNWNFLGWEKKVWEADQEINNRGFKIDLAFAQEAVKALSAEKESLAMATQQATGGMVTAATQRDKMLMYLCEQQGCVLPDLKAATIQEALDDESIEETTKYLLRLRLASAKASTSKFTSLLRSVGKDGRLRGTLQYAGASRTARWSGRIFQPQNLPRPDPLLDASWIRQGIEFIRNGRPQDATIFAPIGEMCSNGLRGLIVAEDGYNLRVGDWSAIEGRVLAWTAGEMWKLKAYAENQDLYCRLYERAFGLPVNAISKKTHPSERQDGKVMDLFGGYGGGVGACVNMSVSIGVDIDAMALKVLPSATPEELDKAEETWEKALTHDETFGLSRDTYVGCDVLKIKYRKANPEIVKLWKQWKSDRTGVFGLEDAARQVIKVGNKDLKIQVGKVVFDCNGAWLRILLPSGRYLSYALPRLGKDGTIWYKAWRNKKWVWTKTHGGKIAENIVQAISRDLLAFVLLAMRAAGFPVVLDIHDEIIAETLVDSPLDYDELERIMTTAPAWAAGLPLNAEGFEGDRYEKR